MNRLKIAGIIIGSVVALLIIVVIALPFLIPADKVKDFAAAKFSEVLKREVKIEKASINIFEGIKLKGVSIANHKDFSKQPFVKAESINLRYAFWPLFWKKVLIKEIVFVKPDILIEKDLSGKTSISDLFAAKPKEKPAAAPNKSAIDLVVSNFEIANGAFSFNDHAAGVSGVKDLNLTIKGITLALLKPVEINAGMTGVYLGKPIPVSIKSKLIIDPSFDKYSIPELFVGLAGETFACPLEIKSIKNGPEIEFKLSSNGLSLEKLAGIFAVRTKPAEKKKGAPLNLPAELKVKGSLDIKKAVFQKVALDRLNAELSLNGNNLFAKIKEAAGYGGTLALESTVNLKKETYSVKNLNLKNLNSGLFFDDCIDTFAPKLLNFKGKTEGRLDLFLSGSGAGFAMPQAFDNLAAEATVVLSDGKLRNLKSLEELAGRYNLSFLKQDLLVKGLRAELALKSKLLSVKSLDLRDTDVEIDFAGTLDFKRMVYQPGNRLTLKISPAQSAGLPKEFALFKDERGFVCADFELQGSLSRPIPSPRLEKPIEKAVGKLKVKIDAKRIEIEQKAQEEAQKGTEQIKNKVKEILKF